MTGQEAKQWRTRLGLVGRDVSRRAGVNDGQYAHWEKHDVAMSAQSRERVERALVELEKEIREHELVERIGRAALREIALTG